MTRSVVGMVIACSLTVAFAPAAEPDPARLKDASQETLTIPPLSHGKPEAGKRVKVTPPEYDGSEVFHTIYLPEHWEPDGADLPIIFEYTGNYFPTSGSTGEPEDAGLGYGLSGGRFIWVSLPYISADQRDNAVTWWGDEKATVDYAKQHVPKIVARYHADSEAVFLCGFSRGAIGVNYIGLHDDEIAGLWTAFITHDHFDGVREWKGTTWGSPLDEYRENARHRLMRVRGRPYLISQNGQSTATIDFVRAVLPHSKNFMFAPVNTRRILGRFPNEIAQHPHTDRWALKPSEARQRAWSWMNEVVAGKR